MKRHNNLSKNIYEKENIEFGMIIQYEYLKIKLHHSTLHVHVIKTQINKK